MTDNTTKKQASAFEDVQIFGAEHLCGLEEDRTFLGNCMIVGFFAALSALAIYVMVMFPQAGI